MSHDPGDENDAVGEVQYELSYDEIYALDNPRPPVTCQWCLRRSDCAASVWRCPDGWFLTGHYGSTRHDLCTYQFVANEPSLPADPVCDDCIDARIAVGDVKLVSTGLCA